MLNRYSSKINFISLIGIAFFIPISKKALPLIILIYGLNWLLIQNYKEKFFNLKRNFYLILFSTSIFLMYLLSLTYTSNIDSGWFDIEVKLSFLLFPFIIFSYPIPRKTEINKIFIAYLSGCFVAVVFSLMKSSIMYINTSDFNSFIYTNFSFLFHPTYFSLYLNFAIIILIFFLFEKEKYYTVEKPLYIFLILLFSISIILANSKTVIFTLIVTCVFGMIHYLNSNKYVKISLFSLSVFILVMFLFIYNTPQLYNRILESEKTFDKYFHNEELRDIDGTSQRILAWKCSIKIINENFFTGVGAGDVKDELIKEYFKKDYYYLVEKKLNSHNQFLQTFVATGIFGFIILVILLLIPLIKSFRKRDFVYFSFLTILILNLLTESMFETQAGVIFFTFFNSYLFTQIKTE